MPPSPRQEDLRQKHAQDMVQLVFHAKVCELLESDRGAELIQKARERVEMWRQQRLCSEHFIRLWD